MQGKKKSGIATGGWYERIQNVRYHNSQAIAMKNSCIKINVEKEVGRKSSDSKNEAIFTGSLAEVYEKALTNVLNIQPHIKMEENQGENEITLVRDKKLTGALTDNRYFAPPEYSISGTYKHSHHQEKHLAQHQNMFEVKKLNTTNKSAFHVPEKRRALSNGVSRPINWSHDSPLPYPVNYPGDYYPVIHPPPFYSRGSPYHNAFMERMNFYHGPRGGECPPFTHVLPWTPFERDFKPWTSPRYCDWRPRRTLRCEPEKETKKVSHHEKTLDKAAWNDKRHTAAPRPLALDEKTADSEGTKSSNSSSELARVETTKQEKCDERVRVVAGSRLEYNVKTRQMRAKKNVFSKENKREKFDSPKEEFLFRLGLTRVY